VTTADVETATGGEVAVLSFQRIEPDEQYLAPAFETEFVVGGNGGKAKRRPLPRWLRIFSPIALIAIWQGLYLGKVVGGMLVPPPSGIIRSFWQLVQNGQLGTALEVSCGRVLFGVLIGVSVGLTLATISGLFRIGEYVVDAPMQMMRMLPILAMVPLFILWFGIGEEAKVLIVAFAVTFPVYINTYAGIRDVDERLVEAGITLGLSRWQLARQVVLPGALPSILVGLRFALGVGWLAVVVSEQINASSGIGYLMTEAEQNLNTGIIMVGLLVYACLGLLTDLVIRLLTRVLLQWRRGFAGR
jgi:sulfonate transport system permease protein